NAAKLVRIRRVDEAPGSDAAAVVARSEAKASRGDLAGALAELAQLAPNARAPAEAWIKSAQARIAAIDASRPLASDALAGPGNGWPGTLVSALSMCSLPPCGGGLGRGVMRLRVSGATCERIALPPPPTPPHKGEGSAPSLRLCCRSRA